MDVILDNYFSGRDKNPRLAEYEFHYIDGLYFIQPDKSLEIVGAVYHMGLQFLPFMEGSASHSLCCKLHDMHMVIDRDLIEVLRHLVRNYFREKHIDRRYK